MVNMKRKTYEKYLNFEFLEILIYWSIQNDDIINIQKKSFLKYVGLLLSLHPDITWMIVDIFVRTSEVRGMLVEIKDKINQICCSEMARCC